MPQEPQAQHPATAASDSGPEKTVAGGQSHQAHYPLRLFPVPGRVSVHLHPCTGETDVLLPRMLLTSNVRHDSPLGLLNADGARELIRIWTVFAVRSGLLEG